MVGRGRIATTAVALATAALAWGAAVAQAAPVADAGALRADVAADPWGLRLLDREGDVVLAENPATSGASGTVGFRSLGLWQRATRVLSASQEGDAWVAELATTDPLERTIEVRIRPSADGVVAFDAEVLGGGPPVQALGMGFGARDGERYLGFGERSDAVDQRGGTVENYVADGPYEADEYALIELFVPEWGFRPRDDATYYPVPWLLSTAGYGVLVDSPETSLFHLGEDGSWSIELVNAPQGELVPPGAPPPERLSLRFFAGPEPADVLERFTRETGRQPPPAAPWVFGPWVQPNGNGAEQLERLDLLRREDAPLSVAQTYRHYLPCGDHLGAREAERQRVADLHSRGLAVTTYLNPMICTDYEPVYSETAASGGLVENGLGDPYEFQYSTDTSFSVAQFDFTTGAGRNGWKSVADEAIADGHDGWMEDFGEYTPLDSYAADGTPGTVLHNPYPRQYHCAAADAVHDAPRPIVRFQRSGWTGTAPCASVVWGGDPTTSWGFDGLQSSVKQALTMGLSGVSTWGSDIGGFFALLDNELSPELLMRWVQFGAVSGVMRTQANGIDIPEKARPQVWDDDQIDNWRRYAKLRTQLYPYLVAADREYRRTGLPLMRHLALAFPRDPRAVEREDEFLFGPKLLAAPVLEPGAAQRRLYLPRGRWVDLWRSVEYRKGDGALKPGRAKLLRGRRDVTVPAPLDELPLFARAGTVLPLLSAKVDTLTDYPDPRTKSLQEEGDRVTLLAFPRERSKGRMFAGERIVSRESKAGWKLKAKGSTRRSYTVRASLKTLSKPFKPCAVMVRGRELDRSKWGFQSRTKVLTTTIRAKRLGLVAKRECE